MEMTIPFEFSPKNSMLFCEYKKKQRNFPAGLARRKWWTSSTVHWVFAVPPQQGSSCWRWVTWRKLKRLPCLKSIKHQDPNVPNVWMVYLHDRWKMATWPRGNIYIYIPMERYKGFLHNQKHLLLLAPVSHIQKHVLDSPNWSPATQRD